ncbi:hypothetical protein QFC20_007081 [Naganishia adeliensis]|uniref:Uncharacterized protein n=1 Tax=Naganishia adeliensis TaxID=92952 RepID=A0ACC2V300_9TREE|nr:hypothetical protein QFC20_007081 [Naganishia adeliensis]
MPEPRPISEIDVLLHHAIVASSDRYIRGERLFPAQQPTKTKRKPYGESIAPTKRRKLSHVKLEPKSEGEALSLEDEILEQLDDEARRAGLDPLAIRDEMPIFSSQPQVSTPRNILPPPPPLNEEPPATDPRPTWSFTTTPLPPHLQRQAQLRSPAAPSTISEEDISEVDELATPGEKGTVTADTSGEGGALTGSPSGKLKPTDGGGTLLSLPRRLWSSIRPGLSL